ncbi:hypothetical protein [Heyndrickxia coagulans]|uniref:Uncharacterized protein n=1 Tax=Heyndrickxia coagulans TaxID=1398 RepID=A0AAW7CHP5_HEYCO|nr:hypothetical protein [Heyndrickxia coagulans]MDL5040845.1 hypothetical protein [Heyndrickxia coagulans]
MKKPNLHFFHSTPPNAGSGPKPVFPASLHFLLINTYFNGAFGGLQAQHTEIDKGRAFFSDPKETDKSQQGAFQNPGLLVESCACPGNSG